ncbi:hypothetical protein CRM22_010138 [Opisthorchis felineus]|uniref:G-protein coupled receptors family 1 profile domain-containing protein n=1 Tax=Opisthorchis felineus TaxID=147828 RepID=A0A4S2L1B7_OPIFE|nr:hypothetical protein CRM22_010138 [Opisthorchis felineus]
MEETGRLFSTVTPNQSDTPFTNQKEVTHKEQPSDLCFIHRELELLFYCFKEHSAEQKIVYISSQIVGLLAIPTIIMGTMSCLLISLLIYKIRHQYSRLSIWGIAICLTDLLRLHIDGMLYCFTTFGSPWWGYNLQALHMKGYIRCKIVRALSSFLSSLRTNLIMFSIFTLHTNRVPKNYVEKGWTMFGWVAAAILRSLTQSYPSLAIYGIWQVGGVVLCLPDPQWPKVYHKFFAMHQILFCEGILECVATLLMCVPLWRQMKHEEGLLYQLQYGCKWTKWIALLLKDFKRNLETSLQELRVVTLQAVLMCTVRVLVWVAFLATTLVGIVRGDGTRSPQMIVWMTTNSIESALLVIELFLCTFVFVIWYGNFRATWEDSKWFRWCGQATRVCKSRRAPNMRNESVGTRQISRKLFLQSETENAYYVLKYLADGLLRKYRVSFVRIAGQKFAIVKRTSTARKPVMFQSMYHEDLVSEDGISLRSK